MARTLRTGEDVLRWRRLRLKHFLSRTIQRVPFYASYADGELGNLPIVDKAILLANFERFNTMGTTLEEVRAVLDSGEERLGKLIVGQSTGTSGNRGVFVISDVERFTWLGVMLAKTLPDIPWVRHKVALALPGYNQLYASAEETRRLAIRFFDLSLGVESWRDELLAYAPDTIVAPPKVLRTLAEAGGLQPRNVFSGAEVLDPLDRAIIEAGFGERVREIYMATEGLFGVACSHGVLHLAEDVVAFEWEPSPGSSGLFTPLVTDFTRSTQIMARYRMNDLLKLSSVPCACGSPLQAVACIEGRRDDIFLLRSEGPLVMVTPDVIRNAVVDADRRIQDFRVIQMGYDLIELSLTADLAPQIGEVVAANLRRALCEAGAADIEIRLKSGITIPMDRKLRRVQRQCRPELT